MICLARSRRSSWARSQALAAAGGRQPGSAPSRRGVKLAASMAEPPPGLVLYVREGCHLCEQFLMELSLELGPAVERLSVVDVDDDADLAIRYGLRVPVLAVGGNVLCEGVLDADRVRAAIRL